MPTVDHLEKPEPDSQCPAGLIQSAFQEHLVPEQNGSKAPRVSEPRSTPPRPAQSTIFLELLSQAQLRLSWRLSCPERISGPRTGAYLRCAAAVAARSCSAWIPEEAESTTECLREASSGQAEQ